MKRQRQLEMGDTRNHFAGCCITMMVVYVWCGNSNTERRQHNNEIWVEKQRASAWKRHKDRPTKGHATNGVEQRRLDELAQRKHVGIHEVHRETSGWALRTLTIEQMTSQTAGWGLNKTIRQQRV